MLPPETKEIIRRTRKVPGWFLPEAHHLFGVLDRAQKERGVAGNLFEIGVWHGKSALMLAAMLRSGDERLGVCDLFEDKDGWSRKSTGLGKRAAFERNLGRHHPDLSFLRVYDKSSRELTPADNPACRFLHIDGSHDSDDVLADLEYAAATVLEEGAVVLDDAYSPRWPGVTDGIYRFLHAHPGRFVPFLSGFGKLVLLAPRCLELYEPYVVGPDGLRPLISRYSFRYKLEQLGGRPAHVFYRGSGPDAVILKGLFQRLSRRYPWIRNRFTRGLNQGLRRLFGKRG